MADGTRMDGPCMKCTTPEFDSAEKMAMSISLNAMDFTAPIDFITYGEATNLYATFVTDTGMFRTKSTITTSNLTSLPRIVVSAQDEAGNTALEDINKDVAVQVRVIKGSYLTEEPKSGWTNDPGVDPATGQPRTALERPPWEHVYEYDLASASAIIRRGLLEMLQPKDGNYRLEFSTVQRCYAPDINGGDDEPLIGLAGFGSSQANPDYEPVDQEKVDECNDIDMQAYGAATPAENRAACE